jgi:hypothetical protein
MLGFYQLRQSPAIAGRRTAIEHGPSETINFTLDRFGRRSHRVQMGGVLQNDFDFAVRRAAHSFGRTNIRSRGPCHAMVIDPCAQHSCIALEKWLKGEQIVQL